MRYCVSNPGSDDVIRRARLALAALLAALLPAAAGALTLVQLSGSGDILIDATGSIQLDTGGNVFDTISLSASSIVIPASSSLIPDTVVSLSGLTDYAASFDDDVRLEVLSWTGTLSVMAAGSIGVSGALLTVDPADPTGGACDVAGGIILSSGGPSQSICPVVLTGPIAIDPGGLVPIGIGPGHLVPEPGAALLFGIGSALLALRLAPRAPLRR